MKKKLKCKKQQQAEKEKHTKVLSVEEESPIRLNYIGNFRLTAYCPCSKCCGKWGKNRPTDEGRQ